MQLKQIDQFKIFKFMLWKLLFHNYVNLTKTKPFFLFYYFSNFRLYH